MERKLLLCAISKNSTESAVAIIQGMSPASWKEPMTAYLAFKVSMRTEDRDLAERCLETIALAPDHINYLGACIAESQQAGDIFCAVSALKKLKQKFEYKEPNPIHLPALFRCTIRLLNMLLNRPDADKATIVEDLCEEFETGEWGSIDGSDDYSHYIVVLAIEKQKGEQAAANPFNTGELEWFARNAYNLALKNSTEWDLRHVVRMLNSCVNVIGHFPSDAVSLPGLSQKSLFARFIISSALISLARTHDNIGKQKRDYGALRTHIKAFDTELVEQLPNLDENSRGELLGKYALLLTFDFEAAVAVEEWDDLGGIVQRASVCKSIEAYQCMADCLLRGQAPGQGKLTAPGNGHCLLLQCYILPCATLSTRSGPSRLLTL